MIEVKGYDYHNDYDISPFTWKFTSVYALVNDIKRTVVRKKDIHLSKQNDDGTFDQDFTCSGSACITYPTRYCHDGVLNSIYIELISEDGKVLFSSGTRTGRRGHISSTVREAFNELREWKKSEYIFAD